MKNNLWITISLFLFLFVLSACGEKSINGAAQIDDNPLITEAAETIQPVVEEKTATVENTKTSEPIVENIPTETVKPTETEVIEEKTAAPVNEGENLLETRCTECHGLGRITSFSGTTEEWTTVIERMMRKGSELSNTEKDILIQFLSEKYP